MDEIRYRNAEQIMREAHAGQFRKNSVTPYEEHPLRVASILEEVRTHAEVGRDPNAPAGGYSEDMVLAGLLHDVLEDGPPEVEWMNRIFQLVGTEVLDLVCWVTDVKLPGTRAMRKRWTLERLRRAPREAQVLKLADRLANVEDLRDQPARWRKQYGAETLRLLTVIGGAHPGLKARIFEALSGAME